MIYYDSSYFSISYDTVLYQYMCVYIYIYIYVYRERERHIILYYDPRQTLTNQPPPDEGLPAVDGGLRGKSSA